MPGVNPCNDWARTPRVSEIRGLAARYRLPGADLDALAQGDETVGVGDGRTPAPALAVAAHEAPAHAQLERGDGRVSLVVGDEARELELAQEPQVTGQPAARQSPAGQPPAVSRGQLGAE